MTYKNNNSYDYDDVHEPYHKNVFHNSVHNHAFYDSADYDTNGTISSSLRRYRISSPQARWYYLLSAVIIIGVIIGFALPYMDKHIARTVGNHTASGQAAQVLESLKVVDHPHPTKRYERDYFGFRQLDVSGQGCDVRETVLARDLHDVHYKKSHSCAVASGTLHDPYTGKIIHFHRGARTSSAVQIDHVVALSNAWASGAYAWSQEKLYKFGNDVYNLLAVDGPANIEKGDASAESWIPSNKSFACSYVARQIGVKARYNLSVTTNEKEAMLVILHGCRAQAVPLE